MVTWRMTPYHMTLPIARRPKQFVTEVALEGSHFVMYQVDVSLQLVRIVHKETERALLLP